jgi:LAO/AO transport system kinase
MPGMGDDIQVIKAGILEVGDIFVINKADREGTDRTENHLKMMIEMDQKKYRESGWLPPVLRTQAVFDKGVEELLVEIDRHGSHLAESVAGLNIRKRKGKVSEELAEMVKNRLIEKVSRRLMETGEFEKAVSSIVEGETDPYTACDDLVLPMLDAFDAKP